MKAELLTNHNLIWLIRRIRMDEPPAFLRHTEGPELPRLVILQGSAGAER